MNRRDALKTIGGLAGAGAVTTVLPACGGSGDDGPNGITTYVYMMMENRSYDHFFGSRTTVENLPGGDAAPLSTKLPDRKGNMVALYKPAMSLDECDPDPPHGWDPQHASFNNGACDQFVVQHQMDHDSDTMIHPVQYLTRDLVPVSYALADAYSTANKWFCSVMGPTWPNRFYWHAGQSFGLKDNQLPGNGQFNGKSIYHRLEAKGIEWGYYYGSIPVVAVINDIPNITDKIHRMSQFYTDAAAGTLPPVVYIDPAFNDNDDHPPVHPINGQALIQSVYQALATSPQWKNCMLVITYDENGGFFDHVPPPKSADDFAADGFDQMGFRVPTMVIGPYVKQGFVSNVVYDHTSALKHLENVFGLDPLTMRTTAANDLTDFIDMDRLAKNDWAKPIDLPDVNLDDFPEAQDPVCTGGSLRTDGGHPVIDWANEHPELVKGIDLRHELPAYRAEIKAQLAKWRKG